MITQSTILKDCNECKFQLRYIRKCCLQKQQLKKRSLNLKIQSLNTNIRLKNFLRKLTKETWLSILKLGSSLKRTSQWIMNQLSKRRPDDSSKIKLSTLKTTEIPQKKIQTQRNTLLMNFGKNQRLRETLYSQRQVKLKRPKLNEVNI